MSAMLNRAVKEQTCGENACHPERSEGSGSTDAEIQSSREGVTARTSQVRSRRVFSPNVWPL